VIGIVAVIALIALGVGGRLWYRSHYFVETENAYVAGHVHPVSARISGVVTRVLIEEGQRVKAGDVIAELDPADQRVKVEQIEAQIASAEQQVLQSGAQIAQVTAQASGARAQVAQSQALLLRTRQDAERYGQLYNTQMKAVSRAELDGANAARAGATADLAARRDNALAAQAQIAAAGSAREVFKAQVKVLQTQLKDARQQLAYNRIVAPVAGRIGKRSVEVGARIQPGQLLAAIVQDEVWITANFKETQLAGIVPGRPCTWSSTPCRILEGRSTASPASGNQFALLPADAPPATSPRSAARTSRSCCARRTCASSADGWCRACRRWPKSSCTRRRRHRPSPPSIKRAMTSTTHKGPGAAMPAAVGEHVDLRTWVAVAAGMLGAFMAVLDIQITNSSLKDILGTLSATPEEGSWISTAYLCAEIVVIPLAALMVRVFSMRGYMIGTHRGVSWFARRCAAGSNLESMIVFRMLQLYRRRLIPMAMTLVMAAAPSGGRRAWPKSWPTATLAPTMGPTLGGYSPSCTAGPRSSTSTGCRACC
jgi:membrane fusion protein (multidrug efflux system)